MKRFLTIFCAIAFSGAALSAQNNADIKYSFTKTLASPFVSLRGGAIADITNLGVRTFASPSVGLDIARFSLKVGYEYQLGFWGYLDGKHMHNVKLGVAYTF